MSYKTKQVAAQIYRLGQMCEVQVRSETGTNEFGNPTDDYIFDRKVIAHKTYPNRNTSVESSEGDRTRDRPVFMVPTGDDLPAPPDPEDVIVYNGQQYEVKAHTPYDTHVEFFADSIIHDESGE